MLQLHVTDVLGHMRKWSQKWTHRMENKTKQNKKQNKKTGVNEVKEKVNWER